MRSRNVRVTALIAAAAVAVAIGSAIAAEGDGDGDAVAAAAGDEVLVDSLLALEAELPAPLPTAASIASDGVDVVLTGSFTTSRSTFDRLEDDLRALYVDASAAATAVGDAISDITRGLLVEQQAMAMLEEVDDSTDARPIDASDSNTDGVAIDADGQVGATQVAVNLLLSAHDLQRGGYAVLAVADGIDGGSTFQGRYDDLVEYRDEVEVVLRGYAGLQAEQLLVPAGRFDAPVGVPMATSVQYVCVDAEAYYELADATAADRLAGSIAEVPDAECAAAARRAGLSIEDQEAIVEQLQGASGASSTEDGDATS